MIGALRATRMAEALRFRVSEVEKVGEDVAVTLYPARGRRTVFTGLVEEVGPREVAAAAEEGGMPTWESRPTSCSRRDARGRLRPRSTGRA